MTARDTIEAELKQRMSSRYSSTKAESSALLSRMSSRGS